MTNQPARITDHQLRAWAKGMYHTEAAVELLIRAFNGRFATPGNDWIRTDDGAAWVDWTLITEDNTAALSGGEQRFLAIVASIGGNRPIILGDTLSFDRDVLDLVLAAIAHAAGSHQHPGELKFDQDGRPTGFAKSPGTLYPWPPSP